MSREHLQPRPPWEKGQSGNPAGRKKGVPLVRTVLQKLVDQEIPDEATGELHSAWRPC